MFPTQDHQHHGHTASKSRRQIFLPHRVVRADGSPTVQWEKQNIMHWVTSLAGTAENGDHSYIHSGGNQKEGCGASALVDAAVLWNGTSSTVLPNLVPSSPMRGNPLTSTGRELPQSWDLSHYLIIDPRQSDPALQVDTNPFWKMVGAAKQLEQRYQQQQVDEHDESRNEHPSCTTTIECWQQDYQKLQVRIGFVLERIRMQYSSDSCQIPVALDALYEEAYDHLVGLTLPIVVPNAESVLPSSSASASSSYTNNCTVPDASQSMVITADHHVGTPSKKQDLTNFMTDWLRRNWTNPYPDDDGLIQMANACGTTPGVVSNWLINARTRKWRPAIVKAVALQHPSDRLLEDSLCIFDGRSTRPLSPGVSGTTTNNNDNVNKLSIGGSRKRGRDDDSRLIE